VLRIAASRGFSELTQNWIWSSHGYSAPSLKISCKSVQRFSLNLANTETNKERNKQTNKQHKDINKEIDRKQYSVPIYRERGNNAQLSTESGCVCEWQDRLTPPSMSKGRDTRADIDCRHLVAVVRQAVIDAVTVVTVKTAIVTDTCNKQ